MEVLNDACDRNWSLLPDYVTTSERPLIDRLVRLGVAPREEVMRLDPDQHPPHGVRLQPGRLRRRLHLLRLWPERGGTRPDRR